MAEYTEASANNLKIQNFFFYDNEQVLLNRLAELKKQEHIRSEFLAVVLCTNGEITMRLNGKQQSIKSGQLFICLPNDILENVQMHFECEFECFGVREQYLQKLRSMTSISWSIIPFIREKHIIDLSDEEIKGIKLYNGLLRQRVFSTAKYSKEETYSLIMAFSDYLTGIIDKTESQSLAYSFTAGERLFKNFIEIINSCGYL